MPPRGVTRCAASPIRNVLSRRKSSAICAANEKAPILSICGSSSGYAGAEPDQLQQPLLGRSRPPARPRDPSTRRRASGRPLRRAGTGPHGIGTDDAVDAVPMLADHVPERRPEQRGRRPRRGDRGPAWGCQSAAHGAVRTVGRDEVASAHHPLVPARHIPQNGMHAVGRVVHADDLGRELGSRPAVGTQMAQHHGLEVILRRARRLDGAEEDGLLRYRHADLDRGTRLGACERLALQHQPARVDRACAHLLLEPPHADQLHGAGADGGRPRQLRRLGAPLDERDRMPWRASSRAVASPAGPAAHDQHRHVVFEFHGLHRTDRSPSDSVYSERHLVLRWTPCQVNTVGLP